MEAHASQTRRFKLAVAAQYAGDLTAFLWAIPCVGQVTLAGSFRRMRETVGGLDILVTAAAIATRMEKLCAELGTPLERQDDRLVYAHPS